MWFQYILQYLLVTTYIYIVYGDSDDGVEDDDQQPHSDSTSIPVVAAATSACHGISASRHVRELNSVNSTAVNVHVSAFHKWA